MASNKRSKGEGRNGGKRQNRRKRRSDGDGSRSKKHHRKGSEAKKSAYTQCEQRQDVNAHIEEVSRRQDPMTTHGDPVIEHRLGRSPLGDQPRSSAVLGERNHHTSTTSDNQHDLQFANGEMETAAAWSEAVTNVATEYHNSRTTPVPLVGVAQPPSVVASLAMHVAVDAHNRSAENTTSVVDGRIGEELLQSRGFRTASSSHGRRLQLVEPIPSHPPSEATVTIDGFTWGTIQSDRPLLVGQRPGGQELAPFECNVEDDFQQADVHHISDVGVENVHVSAMTTAVRAGLQATPENGVDTSAVQHMHNLLHALNPREREAFLSTHNLVSELRSTDFVETTSSIEDITAGHARRGLEVEVGARQRPSMQGTASQIPHVMRSPLVPVPLVPRFVQRVEVTSESGQKGRNFGKKGCVVDDDKDDETVDTGPDDSEQGQDRKKRKTSTFLEKDGKAVVMEQDDLEGAEAERARRKLIKRLRLEVKAVKEGCPSGGGRSGCATSGLRRGGGGSNAETSQKRAKKSKSSLQELELHDPLGPEWAAVQDVPPVQINRLGEPTGPFWDHMKPYIFDRGAYIFPWDVNWNRQSAELKARFILRLRKLYPGSWESKAVLEHLGNNLRERRNRLKRRFKVNCNPKSVTRPKGCTLESWEQILKDLKDPKKKAKSDLCKLKADERVASGASPFSHRTGRGGYRGIVAKFVSATSLRNSCTSMMSYLHCSQKWAFRL
jgi:hypothetical protein